MSTKNEKNNNFSLCFDRIKGELDIGTMTQLAEIVGVKQSTVSKQKAKGEFPVEWAYSIGKKLGILTEWIMEGKGPKRIESVTKEKITLPFLEEIEDWLLTEEKKEPNIRIWFEVEFRKKFPEFKEWKEKNEEDSCEDPPIQKENLA